MPQTGTSLERCVRRWPGLHGYVEENVGALNVKLSGADIARIGGIARKGVAAGARYPEGGMRTING
jgi:hypothetical protein